MWKPLYLEKNLLLHFHSHVCAINGIYLPGNHVILELFKSSKGLKFSQDSPSTEKALILELYAFKSFEK